MRYIERARKLILEPGEFSNYINIEGIDYQLGHIDPEEPGKSASPNGFIFKLMDAQEDRAESVIKICNVYKPATTGRYRQRLDRFYREIEALKMVKENKLNDHVIEFYESGEITRSGKTFDYYTMELGSGDLTTFLKSQNIEKPQKYRICAEIMKSIESLHKIGIYHRDIKPGNFLIVDNIWKIADLGLVDFREEDTSVIDGIHEPIGPRGFLSPEAINKWLGVNLDLNLVTIDAKSDVFQLSKVIGFILFGEILTGMIEPIDLSEEHDDCPLFLLLTKAMQYAKSRRCDLNTFRSGFVEAYGKEYAFS